MHWNSRERGKTHGMTNRRMNALKVYAKAGKQCTVVHDMVNRRVYELPRHLKLSNE
jgi:hypothetical protein